MMIMKKCPPFSRMVSFVKKCFVKNPNHSCPFAYRLAKKEANVNCYISTQLNANDSSKKKNSNLFFESEAYAQGGELFFNQSSLCFGASVKDSQILDFKTCLQGKTQREETEKYHGEEILTLKCKMMTDLISLDRELDEAGISSGADVEQIVKHVKFRIDEILERYGAVMIDDDTEYNCSRHRLTKSRFVEDGAVIQKTVRCGWRFNNYILRKAVVEISEDAPQDLMKHRIGDNDDKY